MIFSPEELRQIAEHLQPIIAETVRAELRAHADAVKPKEFLTLPDAAKLLLVGQHVLRDACKRGELHGLRVGKRYRFRLADLEAWGEARARAG